MIQKEEGIYLISDQSEKEIIKTQEWIGISGIFGGPALVRVRLFEILFLHGYHQTIKIKIPFHKTQQRQGKPSGPVSMRYVGPTERSGGWPNKGDINGPHLL